MRLRCLILTVLLIASQGCKTKQEVNTHHLVDANSIEGFFGIKWGEPIDSAKQMLLQRNPAARISIESPYHLSLMNSGHIADCPFEIVDTKMSALRLEFSSHGFCSALASFDRLTDDQSTILYRRLKETLEAKYGQPSRLLPAEKQFAVWDSRDSCIIIIVQYDDYRVSILYQNKVLGKTYEAEEAEYNKRREAEKVENENRIEQQKKEKILKDL